ncbi:MAG: NAD(P)/FAD-dependent oxidoreductase [Saprospiraceae bacterium]|nr:NAD(P)/FAD-dependent oxidoreductase [Saprospiraceae bacterium]
MNDNNDIQDIRATICIVGAGPAGTYTALSLAKQGVPSLLIDKAVFPRDKACGESLTSGVMRCLQRIDPTLLQDPAFTKARQVVNGVRLYAYNGKNFFLPYRSEANIALGIDSSIGIRRLDLDNILLDVAKKQPLIQVLEGVHIQSVERVGDGLKLSSKDGGHQIMTDLVVVANGYNSRLVKQLTQWDWADETDACGLTAFYRDVEGLSDSEMAECFLMDELKTGAMYVMPVGKGVVNVNIAIRNDIRKRYDINLRETLAEVLGTHPVLKKRFANAKPLGKPMGSGYHLGTRKRPVSGDNYLLVGDAGGFNDALTANGIAHAMESADIAVRHILKNWEARQFTAEALRQFDKEVYRKFRQKRQLGFLSTPMMTHPKLFRWFANVSFGFSGGSETLGKLMYAKNVWRVLASPSFHFSLLKMVGEKVVIGFKTKFGKVADAGA